MTPTSIALTILDGQPLADSRVLATGFGIQHDSLTKTIREHASTLADLKSVAVEAGIHAGKISHYLLTEEQALLLATICRLTPETLAFRVSLTRAFLAMRDQLTRPAVPSNFADALQLAADTERARQALAAQVEAQQPAVDFVEIVTASGDTRPPRSVARFLKLKEADFFGLLQRHGWCYRAGGTGRWTATQHRVRSGDLRMVLSTRERRLKDGTVETVLDDAGKPRTDETMHFTGQGFVRIQGLVRKWLAAEESAG